MKLSNKLPDFNLLGVYLINLLSGKTKRKKLATKQ